MKNSSRLRVATAAVFAAAFLAGCCGDVKNIHEAARRGCAGKAREFLQKDKNLVADRDRKGMTPLHWAADAEMAELLIAAGADVNARANYYETPLEMATKAGHTDVIKVLLMHKAGYVQNVNSGETILHLAAKEGYALAIASLVDGGVPVNSLSSDVRAIPLHYAVLNDHLEAAKALVNKGADVNAELAEGVQTISIEPGRLDFSNLRGRRPLSMAKTPEMKDLLQKHGARE